MHLSAKVFAISYKDGLVTLDTDYPDLPKKTTAAAGALIGNTIYVAGGDSGEGASNNFWSLDLSKRGEKDLSGKRKPPGKAQKERISLLSVKVTVP